jgi:hypothetical protein
VLPTDRSAQLKQFSARRSVGHRFINLASLAECTLPQIRILLQKALLQGLLKFEMIRRTPPKGDAVAWLLVDDGLKLAAHRVREAESGPLGQCCQRRPFTAQ